MTGLRAWRRDPQLPARAGQPELCPPGEDELLDLVTAHALRPGFEPPTSASLTYARWKPGVSLCAAYQLEFADGRSELVALKRYRGGKLASLESRAVAQQSEHAQAALDDGPLRPSLVLPAHGLHLWHELSDRNLPGLRCLADMRRTKRLLQDQEVFSPWRLRSHRCELSRLRYRPERRAVLRLDAVLVNAEGERRRARLAVRALPPDTAARVASQREALGPLALVPQLCASEGRTGLLFEEWIDGLSPVPDVRRLAVAAECLVRLHRRPCRCPAPQQKAADHSALFACDTGLVSMARAASATRAPVPAPSRSSWIHGDVHADQWALRSDGEPVLLDLDALRPGDPAEDLASWIADELSAQPSAPGAGAALLDAYRDAGGEPPGAATLQAWLRLALVDRAAAALRRLELNGVARAEQLLSLAADGVVGASGS